MAEHTIQVSRLFDLVTRQVLELDEAWLEGAVRGAIGPDAGCVGTRHLGAGPIVGVQVRIGRPVSGPRVLTLPMEWEVRASRASWVLSGQIEIAEVGPEDTRIGLMMTAEPDPAGVEGSAQSPAQELAEGVTRSFLHRVFWTLEALNRHKFFDPGSVC